MPYKSEKIKIKGTMLDRRRKISEQDKDKIRQEYAKGFGSWNSLAKKYGVSKKTIGLIVNENLARKSKQRIKDHWKDYIDRKQLTDCVKNLRRYKQDLYKKGIIKEN